VQRAKGWGSGGCAVTYVVGGNSQELAAVAACVLQKPFHRRLDGRGAQEPLDSRPARSDGARHNELQSEIVARPNL
jgi:hypothetical protein